VLRIQLDEAGNVTHSFVQKSSGSDAVDQACKLTSYKWWFEPKLDENRQPQRDEFLFTISFS
jgi:TonB family protein